MVHGIFLSFRKNDSRLLRQRIDQSLTGRFGRDHVFKAGDSIPPGAPYPDSLLHAAANCELMLVLIGPGWLGPADEHGVRSIDRPDDWVRREVAESLRRGNRVIPVLVGDGTMMPAPEQLPEDIRSLSGQQCLFVPATGVDQALATLLDRLIWVLPALAELRPDGSGGSEGSDSEPPPPAPPARQQIQGDHGTNFDNTGGTLHAQGRGTINVGGTHSTTVNNEDDAVTTRMAALTAALASVAALFRRLRTWAAGHPGPVLGGGLAVIAAAGATTFALLGTSPDNVGLSSLPAAVPTYSEPSAPATTIAAVPAQATDAVSATTEPAATAAAVQAPSAGTDVVNFEDSDENTWTETFSIGAPANGAVADQDVVDAAAQCVPGEYNVPDETMVIPVTVTYELTSVEPINNFNTSLSAFGGPLAAVVYEYSGGSYGCNSADGGADDSFALLSPNEPQTELAWVVIYGAYNGQGQPNTSQFSTYVTGDIDAESFSAKVVSTSGPDVCGTRCTSAASVLVTGQS